MKISERFGGATFRERAAKRRDWQASPFNRWRKLRELYPELAAELARPFDLPDMGQS